MAIIYKSWLICPVSFLRHSSAVINGDKITIGLNFINLWKRGAKAAINVMVQINAVIIKIIKMTYHNLLCQATRHQWTRSKESRQNKMENFANRSDFFIIL